MVALKAVLSEKFELSKEHILDRVPELCFIYPQVGLGFNEKASLSTLTTEHETALHKRMCSDLSLLDERYYFLPWREALVREDLESKIIGLSLTSA
jgi:hypothetical protein